jgi:hypothetical protein
MPSGAGLLEDFARNRGARVRKCLHVYLDPADPATACVTLEYQHRKYRVMKSATRLVVSTRLKWLSSFQLVFRIRR